MAERTLRAWEFHDPAEVAERRELQANAAAQREQAKKSEQEAKRAEQQRIRELVFRKGRA
jgi:uncharacterized Fe-S cluster-containing radical SAM superfamily protein